MKTIVLSAFALVLAAGCASTAPPRELVDARAAYASAQQSPGAPMAVNDMRDAQLALNDAENRFKADGDEQTTRDVAYVAQRRAIAAHAKADTMANMQERKVAELDLQKYKENMAAATRGQLNQTKGALAASQQNTESERAARIAAEKRANDALAAIAGLQAQQNERGLVLTLSGSVLFKTGESTLLPAAQKRLNDVAAAIKEDKRQVTVYGFTDSVGTDEANQKLSEGRAAAVRTYLVSQGVPTDKIKSEGKGEADPIADNATPEGRANNRRVEIVLKDASGGTSR